MDAHPNPKPLANSSPGPPEPETELPDQATRHQNSYRKVMLGQVADPIFPSTSQPSDVSEEEFIQQAVEDHGPRMRNRHHVPPLWRWLFLVILVSIVLGIVFAR
jgi:hypothetical protein